jgi:type IV pilus assembly protein PilB
MGDPTNVFAMDDIKFMTGYNVEPVVASEVALRKAIDKHYGTPRSVVLKERAKQSSHRFQPESSTRRRHGVSALTMDDMASVGLGEINMDEITGLDAGADVDVVKGDEGQEIDLSDLAKSSEVGPDHQGHQPHPDRSPQGRRVGHPRRALREGVSRPVPDRRHPPQPSWRCPCARGIP